MDIEPTWYRLALIARRNGYKHAFDYITSLVCANVELDYWALKEIYRAYSDIDLERIAINYLETGEWDNS